MFDSPVETVDRNEMEFVHADVFLDLFDTERRSDEFLADRRVDAVEAGTANKPINRVAANIFFFIL